MPTKTKTRTPLEDKPLHNPGQSLDNAVDEARDNLLWNIVWISMSLVLIFLAWGYWAMPKVSSPIPTTIIGTLIILYAGFRAYKNVKLIRRLRLGRDGEKAVGQLLESMRSTNWILFHDIPGKNFNLDHVLVCNQGIFVIDTKTLSKPMKGETRISVKDGEVYANQFRMDRNPIKQVQALSKWLADLLEKSTGRKFPVQPVVLFPGWFVEPQTPTDRQKAWLLNPKVLPTFVGHEPIRIKDEDVHLISFHLGRYVRNS